MIEVHNSALWQTLCDTQDLVANSGVAALLPSPCGTQAIQVALFWLPALNKVYAVENYDPLSDTFLNARGLIGDLGGEPILATPLYKNHYRLTDGVCLEDDSVRLKTWPVKIEQGEVRLQV